MPHSRRSAPPIGRNLLALVVAGSAVGYANLNFDFMPTGGSPLDRRTAFAGEIPLPAIVPLPVLLDDENSGDSATSDRPIPQPENVADTQVLRGVWGLKMASSLLRHGAAAFTNVPDYTSTMLKQERIGGALSEVQQIDLKVRHEPFSVYMRWLSGDKGRQLIYVDGQNDGNLLVQPGGIKGRLTGVLSLEPTGSLALSEARYPVTKTGILELARIILEYHEKDLARGHGFRCELRDGGMFENRPCYVYTCEYDSAEINPVYRKSIVYVDKALSMPILVKNYTWARDANPDTLDEETLVEYYAYSDLRTSQQLGSTAFDKHNEAYKLRIKK